jgi:hypothetical protein
MFAPIFVRLSDVGLLSACLVATKPPSSRWLGSVVPVTAGPHERLAVDPNDAAGVKFVPKEMPHRTMTFRWVEK